MELIEKIGGPPSGGPSTTVQFVYQVLDEAAPAAPAAKAVAKGDALRALYGIFAEEFKALGGGEAFLRAERESWGPDPWERYALENQSLTENEK